MSLEVAQFSNVRVGLKELLDNAFTISQNMDARLKWADSWKTLLDSRTILAYGSLNEGKRARFKIDNSYNLSSIINEEISQDGSIAINVNSYLNSAGKEFVIVSRSDVKGANAYYAISQEKYQTIKEQLGKGKVNAEELESAGGFKINERLRPEEIIKYNKEKKLEELTFDDIQYVHDGWLELAAGKNNASKEDYLAAAKLLIKYAAEAENQNCFKDGTGMGFSVETSVKNYKVRPLYVGDSDCGSDGDWYLFRGDGHFVRVGESKKVGEADEPQKMDYDTAKTLFLNKPIQDDETAFAVINLANHYFQRKNQ